MYTKFRYNSDYGWLYHTSMIYTCMDTRKLSFNYELFFVIYIVLYCLVFDLISWINKLIYVHDHRHKSSPKLVNRIDNVIPATLLMMWWKYNVLWGYGSILYVSLLNIICYRIYNIIQGQRQRLSQSTLNIILWTNLNFELLEHYQLEACFRVLRIR